MYEWNIDGLSEQELLNKLNHMSMVANSYINKFNDMGQSEIVELLASGFTGTLRNWWEKHLINESRDSIMHAVQIDEDVNPIFDEHVGMGPPNRVNCLTFNIIRQLKIKK